MLNLSLPESFPISVVMNLAKISNGRWETEQWSAIAVVVGDRTTGDGDDNEVIYRDKRDEQTLFPGFEIQLYKDECESYYYNLLAETPLIFVVCRRDEADNSMQPIFVSASYDEAAAYHEADDEVYPLPMPAELCQWLEAYVLENYVPEKKKKRKLGNWMESSAAAHNDGGWCDD